MYDICSKYDVIIVEDDPYWYLQFPSSETEEAKARNKPIPALKAANTLPKKSGYAFIDSLAPSFLSIDVDGRVVRLDTFSKTIAPGCRLGWVTCAPQICERIVRVSESGTQQPSGFVQAMIAETIMGPQPEAAVAAFASRPLRSRTSFAGWKTDGWVRWLAGLRGEYERRMNTMCTLLEEQAYEVRQSTPARDVNGGDGEEEYEDEDGDWGVITKTKLYDFRWPRGGMFLWVRVHLEAHPLFGAMRSGDGVIRVDGPTLAAALMIFLTHEPHLVLASPGSMFSATPRVAADRGWAYFRLCFAAETDEANTACSARFGRGVQAFWRLRKVPQIEALLEELGNLEADRAVDAADDDDDGGLTAMGWVGC